MKCSAKFYGMQVSMTRQYGDFKKLIFTTITHDNKKIGVRIADYI